ncbi:MAG: hypothetical protein IKC48_04660 [Clostridia bacterium]|nr:hypothetical protein [Clostridia bacterium]
MKFSELDTAVQELIVNALDKHIAVTADILKQDRSLIPMLMIADSNKLISLQPKDGKTDVDKAYAVAIEMLKKENFTYAIFSYSTRICTTPNDITDALKTCIIMSNGLEVSFFTPYKVKGLFKKTINIGETFLAELKEKVLD